MKIKQILSQSRRDTVLLMKCEFCVHEVERSGYDDNYFYENVIPKMTCPQCHKSTYSEGGEAQKIVPKYPEGFQI